MFCEVDRRLEPMVRMVATRVARSCSVLVRRERKENRQDDASNQRLLATNTSDADAFDLEVAAVAEDDVADDVALDEPVEAESVDAELDGCVVVVMMMGVGLFVSTIKSNGTDVVASGSLSPLIVSLYGPILSRRQTNFYTSISAAAEAKQSKRRYRNEQRKHQINTNEAVLCVVN